jgi:hypothetical protein
MKRSLTAILAAALLCLSAAAQEKSTPKKSAPMPPMPKPAPEMNELRQLAGNWTSDEQYEANPMSPAGTGSGTNVARLGPGGFSILMEQRSKGTMGNFSGHGVYSWDPAEKIYKVAWVDSMTPGIASETGKKEGDTLVFTGSAMVNGKKVALRDVWSDFTPTSHTLTSYANDGTGEKKVMTVKFTKAEPAAPAKK